MKEDDAPEEPLAFELDPAVRPDYDSIITQDDTPVDSLFAEKQQRLLTEPLHSSWAAPGEGRTFVAMANVGVFPGDRQPPLVPDALLSVDVDVGADLLARENRSYFVWRMGKPPDVVIEIVSDRRGGEGGVKMRAYARIRVLFYVIFDPENHLEGGEVRAYRLQDDGQYHPIDRRWLPAVGLGLTLWDGVFEGHRRQWLRWCDRDGRVIPTGAERADEERRRADEERRRAAEAQAKLERLAAQLRALGVEPEV